MNRIERKLYRLVNLLSEAEGEIVKNKKTGNVYMVKTFDPGKHDKPTPDEIEKAKAAHGGKLPTSDKSAPKVKPESPKPSKKKEPVKMAKTDFQSSAETDKMTAGDSQSDASLKKLMPGIDTSKKSLKDVSPIERQKISMKIDDLAKAGAEAKAKGEKAPNFNLCQVTIPGTNLYCDDNKGIPRSEMPQFKGTPEKGSPAEKLPKDEAGEVDTEEFFKDMLNKDGVKVSEPTSVPPDRLKATQSELVGVKVAGMSKVLDNPEHPAYKKITAPIYVLSLIHI